MAAIERLGNSPSNTLYMGDNVTDAETARRAGIPFIVVLNGVTPREAFADYPTHAVMEKLGELNALLSTAGQMGTMEYS